MKIRLNIGHKPRGGWEEVNGDEKDDIDLMDEDLDGEPLSDSDELVFD